MRYLERKMPFGLRKTVDSIVDESMGPNQHVLEAVGEKYVSVLRSLGSRRSRDDMTLHNRLIIEEDLKTRGIPPVRFPDIDEPYFTEEEMDALEVFLDKIWNINPARESAVLTGMKNWRRSQRVSHTFAGLGT